MSLIEIFMALSVLSTLSIGFSGIYKFLNISRNINALKVIDRSFNEIKRIIKHNSCNTFLKTKE